MKRLKMMGNMKIMQKYKNLIIYIIFGVLTTVINYIVYFPLYYYCALSAFISNLSAWVVSVIFAFFTNKAYVFANKDWSRKIVFRQLASFIGCRIWSGALESALLWFTVDYMAFNAVIWKIILSVLVICMNYFASKLLVFSKK